MNLRFVLFCLVSATCMRVTVSFKFLPTKGSADIPSRCFHPPDSGMCYAYFQNYYYNPASGECEAFVYGGCQGNDNNFYSRGLCEAVCKRTDNESDSSYAPPFIGTGDYFQYDDETCDAPPAKGVCRAIIVRHYFDGEQCKTFVYGGCGGNLNNFRTEEQCLDRCGYRMSEEMKVKLKPSRREKHFKDEYEYKEE